MKKLLSAGPIFIVIASILWSLDGLLRRSLYVLPPIIVVFFEHFLGFLFLLPFLLPKYKQIKKIEPRTWGAFAWITLLSSIGGTFFYTAALGQVQFIQFSVVVLLQQLEPIFAVFFAWLVVKERISKMFILYAIVALFGAYLISFPDLTVNLQTGRGTAIAALLAVAAAFSWGSSTAFSRYVLLRLPTITATSLRFGLGALMGLIFIFVFNQQQALTALSQNQWVTLLAITLSTGMVALLIYYYGLKRTPASVTTILELTWPLSAIVLDYFYFHKTLSPTQILGSIILLSTMYQVSRMSKKLLAKN